MACSNLRIALYRLIFFCLIVITSQFAWANHDYNADPYWTKYDPKNSSTIDHSLWQSVLDSFLKTNEASDGIHRIDYGAIKNNIQELNTYLSNMAAIKPQQYNRAEQFAYWVNLYNAATVKLIATNYPIESITKLGRSWFTFGPWDDSVITIEGKSVTLNDIEHRILRPIWRDYRIHFVVNCASLGCPNLPAQALTSSNKAEVLNQAAIAFVNHPRALSVKTNKGITLSKLFKWYSADFGGSIPKILLTLKSHLKPQKQKALDRALQSSNNSPKLSYQYNWALNNVR